MKKVILILLLSVGVYTFSYAQSDLGTVLQSVGQEYAQHYLAPFTTGLGVNLNSGFMGGYNPSGYSKIPIWPHLYAGVKFSGVVMNNNDKFFSLNFRTTTNVGGYVVPVNWKVYNAPTVFGNSSPAVAEGTFTDPLGQTHTIKDTLIGGLEDTKFIPLVIPQIGIGTILGTDIIFRTVPGVKVGDYGSFKLFGGALRHCIGAYAQMPFDIAVQFGFQSFGIKDINNNKFIDATSYFGNIQINKSFPVVSIYGGAQVEQYSVDVNYKYGSSVISFNQKSENHIRGIAGATVSLGPARFNADVNFGYTFAFTTGFGFGL